MPIAPAVVSLWAGATRNRQLPTTHTPAFVTVNPVGFAARSWQTAWTWTVAPRRTHDTGMASGQLAVPPWASSGQIR
jgi:hypothetical protein